MPNIILISDELKMLVLITCYTNIGRVSLSVVSIDYLLRRKREGYSIAVGNYYGSNPWDKDQDFFVRTKAYPNAVMISFDDLLAKLEHSQERKSESFGMRHIFDPETWEPLYKKKPFTPPDDTPPRGTLHGLWRR